MCSWTHNNREWKSYYLGHHLWWNTSTQQLPACWVRRSKFSVWCLMCISPAFHSHIGLCLNFLLRSPSPELSGFPCPLGISCLLYLVSGLVVSLLGTRLEVLVSESSKRQPASVMMSHCLFWHLMLGLWAKKSRCDVISKLRTRDFQAQGFHFRWAPGLTALQVFLCICFLP